MVLAADARSTRDGEVLPADRIVVHTNATVANPPHPTHEITVTPTAEIAF